MNPVRVSGLKFFFYFVCNGWYDQRDREVKNYENINGNEWVKWISLKVFNILFRINKCHA